MSESRFYWSISWLLHRYNLTLFNLPGDTRIQGLDLLPILISTVEKAATQTTQYPLVTEALSASCLLAKLSFADIQAGEQSYLFMLGCR